MAIDAIISDGTTDINIGLANEIPNRVIERNSKNSASGAIKQQVAGSRLIFSVNARVTGVVYNSLVNLLVNGSQFYFYTPTDTHSMFPDVTFPLAVEISGLKRDWDNRNVYYISFKTKSIDYIEC